MNSRPSTMRSWLATAVVGPCTKTCRTIADAVKLYMIPRRSAEVRAASTAQIGNWLDDGRVLKAILSGLLVALCLVWTVIAGQDVNFDLLNYHYYVAHAFWTDRLSKDFMPASIQSYLNPVAYLPFYWMVQAGWHSLAIGMALAAMHSVNLILLLLVAERTLFHNFQRRHLWAFAAAVAGGLSPVFLSEVGNTFNEVTSSIGILLGIYLLFRRTVSSSCILLAGLAMGIATGLKLSNAIFVAATALSLLLLFSNWNSRARALLWFGAGAALGFALSEGYWAYRVHQEFGNPFFPLMNRLFAAPDFPDVNIFHNRFLPPTLLDAATLPLRMAGYESWTYVEVVAPDLRPLLLIVIAAAALLRSSMRKTIRADWCPDRVSGALLCFIAVSWLLWMATSANGRYGLPVLLLTGPALVWAVTKAFTARAAAMATVAVLGLQIAHYANAGPNPRWSPVPWGSDWFELAVSPELAEKPYLYLSHNSQSFSYIVPYLHPDSAFINIQGQWSIPYEGPGSGRLRAMLDKFEGRTRFLAGFRADKYNNGAPSKKLESVINESLDRLSLRIKPESCSRVDLPLHKPTPSDAAEYDILMSCEVRKIQFRDPYLMQEENRLRPVFEAFEAGCPAVLSPPGSALERVDKLWRKYYVNTDSTLWSDGILLFYSKSRGKTQPYIGSVSDFATGNRKIDCRAMPQPLMSFYSWTDLLFGAANE